MPTMASDPTFDLTDMENLPDAPPHDDEEKTTPTRGRSPRFRPVEDEFCVKWTFYDRPVKSDINLIAKSHCEALNLILNEHNQGTLIIDNKKEQHSQILPLITNPAIHLQKFTIRRVQPPKSSKPVVKYVICHRFISKQSLGQLKQSPGLSEYLRTNKIYLHLHEFDENTWNTTAVGFLFNTHVQHVLPCEAKSHLMDLLTLKGADCPYFSLNRTKISNGNGPADRTVAYEVRCPKDDLLLVKSALQKATTHLPLFMSHHMKRKNPTVYSNAIRMQNKCLTDTWVIKVAGIDEDGMKHLEMKLSTIPGYMSVCKTPQFSTSGQWKILVQNQMFNTYFNQLRAHWSTYISRIPPDILTNTPTTFPEPKIESRKPGDEAGSSTEGSYDTAMSTILGHNSVDDQDDGVTLPSEFDNQFEVTSVPDIRSELSAQTNPQSDYSPPPSHLTTQLASLMDLIKRQQDELDAQRLELAQLRAQQVSPSTATSPTIPGCATPPHSARATSPARRGTAWPAASRPDAPAPAGRPPPATSPDARTYGRPPATQIESPRRHRR